VRERVLVREMKGEDLGERRKWAAGHSKEKKGQGEEGGGLR
jgi:hypothetical protein